MHNLVAVLDLLFTMIKQYPDLEISFERRLEDGYVVRIIDVTIKKQPPPELGNGISIKSLLEILE